MSLAIALGLGACTRVAGVGESERAARACPEVPSDVMPALDTWKITLGSGETVEDLLGFEDERYFYTACDDADWVVYKTPNSGGTTPNSSNTRTELRHLPEWVPEVGGRLEGTLKVMHVSTTGDARVPAAFSVVVGQIHSSEGHENEPIKIYYKKFPGHENGSVFWNYEINTEGDNSERWDVSIPVWGHDFSVVGSSPDDYPDEPQDGLALGEEFSYEINVTDGVMHVSFRREGHEVKTFAKSLIASEYSAPSDVPQQVLSVFASTGQDGTERPTAYAGELQYFKQGAYNQANGKNPKDNMVWNTGSETYGGRVDEQYARGSYAEVWFRSGTAGPAVPR
ncbi:polysaccharide lyase family 7 protein [Rubricoccus marinus]|uniref:polysaccharide lyase family 7 protein n=1 Tax=Rubricoccus marinus TaxID=716817 RepID=UPI001C5302A2|nr:polysaccharide lyase family 7 protein [Rubricoccus marinus]